VFLFEKPIGLTGGLVELVEGKGGGPAQPFQIIQKRLGLTVFKVRKYDTAAKKKGKERYWARSKDWGRSPETGG